ncbi:AAA family ATPase [Anaerosporobacter sp.]|uniref:AAA family ATPase n=1 Tax=Anaerosporobacter sp. TaxID=1872529 RepID=UPI00286F8DAE|nr:AAA family ATPase [Anaerosporobacter sp.]
MIYLDSFSFPDSDREFDFFLSIQRNCYNSYYPFKILSQKELSILNFEPITILYGGNGSGKTTALNVISEKLNLRRDSRFNQSNFFPNYIDLCDYSLARELPSHSRVITSDDVFDYMLNVRMMNEGIDGKREELFEDYLDAKYSSFQFTSINDYEKLKKVNQARSKTQSKYIRNNLVDNIREHSNGENAFLYFMEKIEENGLYLLDEPENSLSPERQLEFVKFIEDSVRFFGCQFIISTHSPFLLAMRDAKIYDLDETPVRSKPWTSLKNVQVYHAFFEKHRKEF